MKLRPNRKLQNRGSLAALQARLDEAEETLRAIRGGDVDALVVGSPQGDQVFTLKGADHSYRVIVEQMQEGAVTLTPRGVIVYCNRRFADLVNSPLEQLIGGKIRACIPLAERKKLQALLDCCATQVCRTEMLFQSTDGATVPCMVAAAPLDLDGVKALCLVVTDLSEQHRTEEKLRLMIDNARDYSFYMIDPRGLVTTWTTAAERMYGYSEREMVGNSFTILRGNDPDAIRTAYRSLEIATRTGSCDEEGWRISKDGRKFKVNVLTTALRNADGTLRGFSRFSKDITGQHQLEQEILEAGAREQRRIGMDLHDNLGQQLTGISYLLEATLHELPSRSPAAGELKRIYRLLNRALEHTRAIAHGLCPVELKGSNLRWALRDFARSIEKLYEVRCRLRVGSVHLDDGNLAPTQLYLILQEAVVNAIKHGKATQVEISLSDHKEITTLTVKDNGIGFKNGADSSGIGLQTMAYRARTIGGSLQISPGSTRGTVVTCTFHSKHNHNHSFAGKKRAVTPRPVARQLLPF